MRPASSGKPIQTDGDGLADTRVRFLTAEPVEPGRVREPILASWWRSRESNVAADRIKMPYVHDPNLDTPLTRSAEPVLRQLLEQLAGQPISIVLTDQAGLVLSRLTGDPNLARHLDTRAARSRASAMQRSSWAPTGSALLSRAASRCTCSVTSTMRRISRTWRAPAYRSSTRSRARLSAQWI